MLLNPLLAARSLGIDTGTDAWAATRNAVERCEPYYIPLPLDEIEAAFGARISGYAAAAATLATGLVAELCGGGFPWGSPPREDYADALARAAPWARDLVRENDRGLCVPSSDGADEDYIAEGAPIYASAHRVMEVFLGVSSTSDPDGPSNDATPAEIHERAVQLAIALLSDVEHSIAEVAAGAAAWLLVRFGFPGGRESAWAVARARRICSCVGVRFPGGA